MGCWICYHGSGSYIETATENGENAFGGIKVCLRVRGMKGPKRIFSTHI